MTVAITEFCKNGSSISYVLEATMSCRSESGPVGQRASDHSRATLYVSLELSPSKWLVTSLVSGTDKLSKHLVPGGDCGALLQLLAALKAKAEKQSGMAVVVATIQEAGLDGFSLHRLLEANGAESWIVDPSSVAAPRRARRAKSDAIDGETLLRTLLAYRRGEPRVCSMVHPTSPHDEDRRRLTRERRTLMRERIEHTKGPYSNYTAIVLVRARPILKPSER